MSIALLMGISATLIVLQSLHIQESSPLFGYLFGIVGLAFVFVVGVAGYIKDENKNNDSRKR